MSSDFDNSSSTEWLLGHFDETMSDTLKKRADHLERMNKVYIGDPTREAKFLGLMDDMLVNARASLRGHGSKECAYFVIGESGSGKSTMIEHHLGKMREFQPFTIPSGDLMRPIISFEAPKPCDAKKFAATAARTLGFDLSTSNTDKLFINLNNLLKANATLFMHVDEAQHFIRFETEADIARVQDNLKARLQVKGWPLHILFSGMPNLEDLKENDQMANRGNILRLPTLDFKEDGFAMKGHMMRIVTKHARLQPSGIDADVFTHQIMRSVGYQFGSFIQMVRLACSVAFAEDSDFVTEAHFATAFEKNTACSPDHNFFITPHWMSLKPGKLRQTAKDGEVAKKGQRRK